MVGQPPPRAATEFPNEQGTEPVHREHEEVAEYQSRGRISEEHLADEWGEENQHKRWSYATCHSTSIAPRRFRSILVSSNPALHANRHRGLVLAAMPHHRRRAILGAHAPPDRSG
jgi:hypothetical protein